MNTILYLIMVIGAIALIILIGLRLDRLERQIDELSYHK